MNNIRQKTTATITRLYSTGVFLSVSNRLDDKNSTRNAIYVNIIAILYVLNSNGLCTSLVMNN